MWASLPLCGSSSLTVAHMVGEVDTMHPAIDATERDDTHLRRVATATRSIEDEENEL